MSLSQEFSALNSFGMSVCGSQELSHEGGTVESTRRGNGRTYADYKFASPSWDGSTGLSHHWTYAIRRSETESECHEWNDNEPRQYVTSTINHPPPRFCSHTFFDVLIFIGYNTKRVHV